MHYLKHLKFIVFLCCITTLMAAQSIIIDDSKNAVELVNTLTNNSSCAIISGQNLSGNNSTPTKNSYGYFSNTNPNFPFKEGIVLSTWGSKNSEGPFLREPINGPNSGSSSWKGDTDLEQALGITNTTNATTLEFDFIPVTTNISFNYLFASNEYLDNFPCNYSDGFAFLIKEDGSDSYVNLAVLPGTATTVSSQNVHPTIPTFNSTTGPKPGCPALNETYFGNFNTDVSNSSPINYAGQTVVLTAQTDVTIGKKYHIKLVIADHNGELYDSAIFLEANSFTAKVDLGSNQLLSEGNGICFGQDYTIDTKLPASYSYYWFKDNILLPGESSPTLTVTQGGRYKVEATLNPLNCVATNEVTIEYTPEITLKNTSLLQCDENGDGITTFDLNKADIQIINNNSNLSSINYFESMAEAIGGTNPILNKSNYTNKSPNQKLIAKLTDGYACPLYAELTLQTPNNTINPVPAITQCDQDNLKDGIFEFNLNSDVTPILLNGLAAGLAAEYYSTSADAYRQKDILPNLFKNNIPYQQTIYARINNGADCYIITAIPLEVTTFTPFDNLEETLPLCSNTNINLEVDTGYQNYLWSTGETSNTITIDTPGDYSVTIINSAGCAAKKVFHIQKSEIATINEVEIKDFSGNDNSAQVKFSGTGNYEFSLDGINFQESPDFNNLSAGAYSIVARDKNGCGLSDSFTFTILDYPHYFTPNGDGFNDTWQIKNLDKLPASTLLIYNRYGHLIKNISNTDFGWDGTLNSNPLPADDYWFTLVFNDGKIIRGHFTLKR